MHEPLPRTPTYTVGIELADANRSTAVRGILDQAGLRVTDDVRSADRVVSDRATAVAPVDVLVVPATPLALRDGVVHFAGGRARSIVSTRQPEDIVLALALLEGGYCLVPLDAHDAMAHAPELTCRQRRVWQGVVAGQSNASVAQALGVSVITVKREVAGLYRVAGVASRAELWAAGVRLGLEARLVRP